MGIYSNKTDPNESARTMTKREAFALALHSKWFSFDEAANEKLASGLTPDHGISAKIAVNAADALIDALNGRGKAE